MRVLGQYCSFHCGSCGQPLRFEQGKVSEEQPYGIGACSNDAGYSNITGELLREGCARAGIRLKVMLTFIEAEELP